MPRLTEPDLHVRWEHQMVARQKEGKEQGGRGQERASDREGKNRESSMPEVTDANAWTPCTPGGLEPPIARASELNETEWVRHGNESRAPAAMTNRPPIITGEGKGRANNGKHCGELASARDLLRGTWRAGCWTQANGIHLHISFGGGGEGQAGASEAETRVAPAKPARVNLAAPCF